jgi:hypothetical protein
MRKGRLFIPGPTGFTVGELTLNGPARSVGTTKLEVFPAPPVVLTEERQHGQRESSVPLPPLVVLAKGEDD